MGKRNKKRILATMYDADGKPIIEFYDSSHKNEPVVRFRVIGANGEIMPHPYTNVANAKRGSRDLFERLQRAYDPLAVTR